jgi:hypothetical protein
MRSSSARAAPRAPIGRRWRLATVVSSVVLLAVAACGADAGTPATPNRSSESNPSSITLPSGSLHPSTLTELVAYLANSGLAVPNPRDVTQRDCPPIDCTSKVETDAVAIMAFASTGKAQLYAGSTSGVFQVANLVMSFSASVPAEQRRAYDAAVQRAIE